MNSRNGQDALVIDGAEFAAVLQELIDYKDEIFQARALGEKAGLRWIADLVEADTRRVRDVMAQKWVTLDVADRWLTRLGMTHVLPHLSVVPNPKWSVLHWVEYMAEQGSCYYDG